jgi:hypothetical protein
MRAGAKASASISTVRLLHVQQHYRDSFDFQGPLLGGTITGTSPSLLGPTRNAEYLGTPSLGQPRAKRVQVVPRHYLG